MTKVQGSRLSSTAMRGQAGQRGIPVRSVHEAITKTKCCTIVIEVTYLSRGEAVGGDKTLAGFGIRGSARWTTPALAMEAERDSGKVQCGGGVVAEGCKSCAAGGERCLAEAEDTKGWRKGPHREAESAPVQRGGDGTAF